LQDKKLTKIIGRKLVQMILTEKLSEMNNEELITAEKFNASESGYGRRYSAVRMNCGNKKALREEGFFKKL
jgi:hypothetical protein